MHTFHSHQALISLVANDLILRLENEGLDPSLVQKPELSQTHVARQSWRVRMTSKHINEEAQEIILESGLGTIAMQPCRMLIKVADIG